MNLVPETPMPRVNDKKEFQGTISDFISKNVLKLTAQKEWFKKTLV